MPAHDFRSPRLYVDAPLGEGQTVALERDQSNYLGNVLRLSAGDSVLVFNGCDGEWRACIAGRKRPDSLAIESRIRPQDCLPDLTFVFAPLKHARLDYMVQKAVELGSSRLQPVLTRHTQAARVNLDRMRANAIEAAEQCGILNVCEIGDALPLSKVLAQRAPERVLIFCDEDAPTRDPAAALSEIARGTPLAVLVGPEGGFAEDERELLLRETNIVRLALGPRILRADTAAISALTLAQTMLGDWG